MRRCSVGAGVLLSIALASAAGAATSSAYAALDRRSSAACAKASGLRDARVAEPVRFSDTTLVDARVVAGVYPQPHMKGAAATMLCLYNRRTGHAEAVEATSLAAAPAAGSPAVKDIWWRAEDIGGAGVVDNSNSTLMFGSDGKVAGKSGCNNYSASYQLTGAKLRVFPPMIGTRMMCPPAIMTQEARFQKILSEAEQATVSAEGALVVTAKDKKSIRFFPEKK